MMKRAGFILLLMTALLPSGGSRSLVVVANSIDAGLNSGLEDFLGDAFQVTVVQPGEFNAYMKNPFILILGGPKAEGTGEILHPILTDEERERLQEGDMVVKLNVWEHDQVVAFLAGPDREGTALICEKNKKEVRSLFKGVETLNSIGDFDHDTIVFLWPAPLQATDMLSPYAPSFISSRVDRLPLLVPYSLRGKSWFLWVDDAPCAKYAHPTRFFLFSVEEETYTLFKEKWWPVLNGKPLWIDKTFWDSNFWVYNSGVDKPRSETIPFAGKEQNEYKGRALIVNGWSSGQSHERDMAEDEKGMKEFFTAAGMETLSVSTVGHVEQTLTWWAGDMAVRDTLIVYVTAHGGEGYVVIGGEIFTAEELTALLERFKGVYIHVTADSSCGGAFRDTLQSVCTTFLTATGRDDPAYGDWDPPNDPNPGDKGSEFTGGLVMNGKELLRYQENRERWQKEAASKGEGWYTYFLIEVFERARESDASFIGGKSTPALWKREVPLTATTPGGSGCPCGH